MAAPALQNGAVVGIVDPFVTYFETQLDSSVAAKTVASMEWALASTLAQIYYSDFAVVSTVRTNSRHSPAKANVSLHPSARFGAHYRIVVSNSTDQTLWSVAEPIY